MEDEKFLKFCTLERLKGHTAGVTALTCTPAFDNENSFYSKTFLTEGVLASGSEDGTIRIWDARVNKYSYAMIVRSVIRIAESFFLSNSISSLCFHKSGLELFSACGNIISQFDLRKPSVLMSAISQGFGEAKDDINKILIDSTGENLISCDDKYYWCIL